MLTTFHRNALDSTLGRWLGPCGVHQVTVPPLPPLGKDKGGGGYLAVGVLGIGGGAELEQEVHTEVVAVARHDVQRGLWRAWDRGRRPDTGKDRRDPDPGICFKGEGQAFA